MGATTLSEGRTSSTAERPAFNREASGSSPECGSTFAYCVVRKELSGGALLAHVFHAGREAKGPAASEDERVCILLASKADMEKLASDLTRAGYAFKMCIETDGPMAGSTPSIGFSLPIDEKPKLKPILGHLQVWSERAQKRAEFDTLSPAEPELSVTKLPARAAHVSEHSGGDPNS